MRHIQVNLWQLIVNTLEALCITCKPINSLTNNLMKNVGAIPYLTWSDPDEFFGIQFTFG